MRKFLGWLDTLDRRWIFLAIALSVIIPLIRKSVFPEKASPLVQSVFDYIEELPADSKVLLSCDYDPGSAPELQPMATAVARHLCERKHKIYFMALWPVGPEMVNRTVRDVIEIYPGKFLEQAAFEMNVPTQVLEKSVSTLHKVGRGRLTGDERTVFDDLIRALKDDPKKEFTEEEKRVLKKVAQEGILDLSVEDKRMLAMVAVAGVQALNSKQKSTEGLPEAYPGLFEIGLDGIQEWIKVDMDLVEMARKIDEGVQGRSHPEMVYGTDYVNLGFKPGNEGVIKVIVTNLKKLFNTDFKGTNIDAIDMCKEITSVQDMDLIVNISAGYPGTKEWVQYAAHPYKKPIAAGCTGVQAPLLYPYIPKPLFGLLGAIKSAAEYESLLRTRYPKFDDPRLNQGHQRMGPQMVAHLTILILIIIGNVSYFATRRRRKQGGGG